MHLITLALHPVFAGVKVFRFDFGFLQKGIDLFNFFIFCKVGAWARESACSIFFYSYFALLFIVRFLHDSLYFAMLGTFELIQILPWVAGTISLLLTQPCVCPVFTAIFVTFQLIEILPQITGAISLLLTQPCICPVFTAILVAFQLFEILP